MDPPGLQDLPTEILWRIATLGPADSVISAMRVCHRLYDTLFDVVVFRQILESGGHIDLDTVAPNMAKDARAWAQLALADCRARQISFPSSSDLTAMLGGGDTCIQALDQFAPSLIALKHAIISSPSASETFLAPFCAKSSKLSPRRGLGLDVVQQNVLGATSPGLAFALCASTLSCPSAFTDNGKENPALKLIGACAGIVESLDLEERESYGGVFSVSMAHVALSAWASLLRAHIDYHGDRDDPHIPSPSSIPWLKTNHPDQIPFPFRGLDATDDPTRSRVSWDQWYKNRIEHMTDPAYLTEGEWCGYWSFDNYPNDSISVDFAEAIDRMVLVVSSVRRSPRNGGAPTRIIATYPNALHNFVLEGSITDDGVFDLGPPGDFWVWRGRMTPFGLFGFWGSSDWSRIAGACWLWKRSWCEKTA